MLMDWSTLVEKYRLDERVTGVVHCGAHLAEEAHDYASLGLPVWWVEANPNLYPEIERALAPYPEQHLIEALLSDVDGREMTLHISGPDYRGSSSVLDWGTHTTFSDLRWVDHVQRESRTLDTLRREHHFQANMLSMDLQGYELTVLRGAPVLLGDVNWIMTEVNRDEVYVGCARVEQLDAFLDTADPGPGFDRVETHWVGNQGWGDAWYVRRGQL